MKKIIIFIAVMFVFFSMDARAATQCMKCLCQADCAEMGYSLEFCKSRCAYTNGKDRPFVPAPRTDDACYKRCKAFDEKNPPSMGIWFCLYLCSY